MLTLNWPVLLFSADEEFDDLCFQFGLELDEVVNCLFFLFKILILIH